MVENGDDVFRGEKKPDYKGKVDMEKSPGGNWEWWEAKGIWTEYTGESFVTDASHIKWDKD